MVMRSVGSIDEYIAQFSPAVQAKLRAMRELIRRAAPAATERISYGIPTFHLNGNLVHFAAFKRHIGFYPTASAVAAFDPELAAYKRAKGSIQFPLDEPLPLELIRRMVESRVAENAAKKPVRERKARRASTSVRRAAPTRPG
jgi:uncharacterized protein YdhG (YjbR/CyaY superfamily)